MPACAVIVYNFDSGLDSYINITDVPRIISPCARDKNDDDNNNDNNSSDCKYV